jgi:ribose transport system substrate-binding protein
MFGKMKKVSILLLILTVFLFAGCMKKTHEFQKPEPLPKATRSESGPVKTNYTVTMIAKSSTNPVFLSAKKGAEDAAKYLSNKLGININIDWRTPETEDVNKQIENIVGAVNDKTDAILISCSDSEKLKNTIDEAVEKGVPVMTFDSDSPLSKRFAFYGVNNQKTGEIVMRELCSALKGKGNVAILTGNKDALNLKDRVNGAKKAALKYKGIKVIGVYDTIENSQDSTDLVIKVNKENPKINGWAMLGGWPLFSDTLLNTLDPSRIKIVAVDALPQELAYIENGISPALLAQPTYKWGYVSMGLIIDKIYLKKDVNTINQMELIRVSKENLGEWARQLKDWGFTDIPGKYLEMNN